MATRKNIFFFGIPILLLVFILSYVFFPDNFLRNFLFGPKVKPGTCASDDKNCFVEKKMTGVEVAYALHQCVGPKGCHEPEAKDITAATAAIRAYTKNAKLQVIPINGITPAGIIYYCATDNRCWSVDAKTNTVVSTVAKLLESPTPSKQNKRNHP